MDKETIVENYHLLKKQIPELCLNIENIEAELHEDLEVKPKEDTNVLCVFGITPYLSVALKHWLKQEEHYLVFIGCDLNCFASALFNSEMLKHPRIFFYRINHFSRVEETLKKIAWKFVFLNAELKILSSFQNLNPDVTKKVEGAFDKIFIGVHLSASKFSDFGISDAKNIYRYISHFRSFHLLNGLKGVLQNVPAVIVGAGPSFNEKKEILDKLQDKALIFSGGSALRGIKDFPLDIIGCVDEKTPNDFYEGLCLENSLFFHTMHAPIEIVKLPFLKKIVCKEKSAYLIDRWLNEYIKMPFSGLDLGWTVSTFLTNLAIYLGCSPIIFIGMDLCFTGNDIYAKDVPSSSYKMKTSQAFIKTKAVNGRDVFTQNDWQAAAHFLQDLTSKYSDRVFYTTSDKGLDLGENIQMFNMEDAEPLKRLNKSHLLACFNNIKKTDVDAKCFFNLKEAFQVEEKSCNDVLGSLEQYWNRQVGQYKEWPDSWCQKNVLKFLWDIWKYPILRDSPRDDFSEMVNQSLFYKNVLDAYIREIDE